MAVLFCATFSLVSAQEFRPEIRAKKIQETLRIDGALSEDVWATSDVAKDFWQYFPFDSSYAIAQTEVRILYNEQFLYLGFTCYDVSKGPYITTSLRRDFRGLHNDVMTVLLDPFGDQTNGMLFGISPFGVQREALVSGNSGGGGISGSNGFDLSWDNKWFSEARIHEEGYWTAELAIPFKTLRFKDGATTWRANFYRMETKIPERSTWGRNPRNMDLLSMAFGGFIHFEEPLKKPGANFAIIPFLAGGVTKDHIAGTPASYQGSFGGDAKIAVTPSLNLDLTLNPDFSQVEVDVQQTNITRFELFFPERRQFFLENADIFASFGANGIRPFFSRRIGLALDPNTGLNVPNTIHFGARLSGRINEDWRIGAMNMQTAKDPAIDQPGFNYSVLALQRQVFARSNISGIFINKQATHVMSKDSTWIPEISRQQYHRLAGLDYNLASADNRWNGKIFYHQAMDPGKEAKDNFSHGASLMYNVPALQLSWVHQVVGRDFRPDVGFVPRNNYTRIAPGARLNFYPNKKVVRHGPGIESETIWTEGLGRTDFSVVPYYMLTFKSNAIIWAGAKYEYTYLFDDFKPVQRGTGIALPKGSDYRYTSMVWGIESDMRQKVYCTLEGNMGEFYNGNLVRVDGNVNFRYKQYGIATLNLSYNQINLPDPFTSGTIFLLGPRFDITFTRDIFLTTFFQYNNQLENVNINARLQYRFRPVSDFFLVYTDNYFSDTFKVKNRALVAKLTYWFTT